jgi:acetylornithine/N-succinyldiaminopimelate aminotransferase
MEKGLLINCTNGNVLRFVPPLILTRQHVDKAIGILDEVLASC